MPLSSEDLNRLLKEAFPDSKVVLDDLRGDGDHWAVNITSNAFRGLSRIEQHRLVHAALEGRVGGVLHAIALTTAVPKDGD